MTDIHALLDEINRRHGTAFGLVARYARGEQGAFALEDGAGRRYALKRAIDPGALAGYLDGVRRADAATAVLRGAGYPAPRYVLSGIIRETANAIQEALPGTPLDRVAPGLLAHLLELNNVQRDRATSLREMFRVDWPAPVVNTVLHGGDGYCLLSSLQTYSRETAELLARLQAIVLAYRGAPCPTGDVVHWDFQSANILVDGEAVSGVVDWEGTCLGDCTFDLATLLYYAFADGNRDAAAVRDTLGQHALERVAPGVFGMYLAHMILRQVDWSIRFYDHAVVARYLDASRHALHDVAYHMTH